VKLFGRWGGSEKCEELFVFVAPLPATEFVNRAAYARTIKPASRIRVLRSGITHEFPENIGSQFFRAARIVDDSGDDPCNSRVVQVEELPRVRATRWGDHFRKRMAFRVHTD
jgi:hypothetical protein